MTSLGHISQSLKEHNKDSDYVGWDTEDKKAKFSSETQNIDKAKLVDAVKKIAKADGYSDVQIDYALNLLPKGKDPIAVADLQKAIDALNEMKKFADLDLFAVLALMYKLGVDARKSQQDAARVAGQAQVESIQKQADHAASAAGWALAAGIVSGGAQILAGATNIVGSLAGGAAGGGKLGKTGAELVQGGFGGFAKVLEGTAKIGEAGLNLGAQLENAAATREKGQETIAANQREEWLKSRDLASELLQGAKNTMSEVLQSQERLVSKIFA